MIWRSELPVLPVLRNSGNEHCHEVSNYNSRARWEASAFALVPPGQVVAPFRFHYFAGDSSASTTTTATQNCWSSRRSITE